MGNPPTPQKKWGKFAIKGWGDKISFLMWQKKKFRFMFSSLYSKKSVVDLALYYLEFRKCIHAIALCEVLKSPRVVECQSAFISRPTDLS